MSKYGHELVRTRARSIEEKHRTLNRLEWETAYWQHKAGDGPDPGPYVEPAELDDDLPAPARFPFDGYYLAASIAMVGGSSVMIWEGAPIAPIIPLMFAWTQMTCAWVLWRFKSRLPGTYAYDMRFGTDLVRDRQRAGIEAASEQRRLELEQLARPIYGPFLDAVDPALLEADKIRRRILSTGDPYARPGAQ